MLTSAVNLSRVSSRILAAFRVYPTRTPAVAFSSHHLPALSRFSHSFHSFFGGPISTAPHDVPSLCPKRISILSGPKATALFSSASDSDIAGREVLVQHLLVKDDDLKLLSELENRISDGEDLGDLAVEHSICPSKKEGGKLGWVSRGQMVPEFEESAFSAPLNQVVRCKTQFGWHLLQVLSEREGFPEIQVEELHSKMQDPTFMEKAQLIDVREPDEIAKASLPGFKVLPLLQFESWAPEITTKIDPQKDTYVMCRSGRRSLRVAKWLQTQGFKRVFNVAGGIHAYALKIDPSVPIY